MASSLSLLLVLVLLLNLPFLSLSSALPHEAILDAADILSDSGYVSMALTLEVIAETLLTHSSSATIFAPSESAFRGSGQPTLDLLRFHIVPLPLHQQSLRLLPSGAKIPTMLASHSLIVTKSNSDLRISLNNVMVTRSPIYDDGSLLIYGIERFFDPDSQYTGPNQRLNPTTACGVKKHTLSSSDSFDQAIESLKSGGYSVMGSFLGMQLFGIVDQTAMTVFAPADEMVLNRLGDFSEYPSFFRRHVVPCKLVWNDLVDFNDGSELPTFLEGFTINVTRSGGVLILNGVPVFFPDIFFNDKLVVHGVSDVLAPREKTQEVGESYIGTKPNEENVFDPGEF